MAGTRPMGSTATAAPVRASQTYSRSPRSRCRRGCRTRGHMGNAIGGSRAPEFVIAEVGSVHDGSIGNACRLIDAAAEAKADAVKFQTHIADAESLPDAPSPSHFSTESRVDYFRRTAFSRAEWRLLRDRCEARGVEFMSSPFSEEAVDLLREVGVQRWKVPSGEVTNLPLLLRIARLRQPVLLSSGMSCWSELDAAVAVFRQQGIVPTLLQCTSEYPCPVNRVGLNVMLEMEQRYRAPVGLSDHTLTPFASFAAVALGASVLERHFTFSRKMYGSDAAHSLEPAEFEEMVHGIRAIEVMRSTLVNKDDIAPFAGMRRVFTKSVVTRRPVA